MKTVEIEFSELKGKTLDSIKISDDKECMKFTCDDGTVYRLIYHHDCCASCSIEDICGDLEDLIGHPILVAEEVSSHEHPDGKERDEYESFTWVFYKLDTIKGGVTIRWYGESNGYYSERASFEQLVKRQYGFDWAGYRRLED